MGPRQRSASALHDDLLGVGDFNLRIAAITGNAARHANHFVAEELLRHTEAGALFAPNQDGEDLFRVGFVEIQERRLSARAGRVTGRRDLSADRGILAKMVPRFSGGQRARILRRDRHRQADRQHRRIDAGATHSDV
jgi:hypothetical protein